MLIHRVLVYCLFIAAACHSADPKVLWDLRNERILNIGIVVDKSMIDAKAMRQHANTIIGAGGKWQVARILYFSDVRAAVLLGQESETSVVDWKARQQRYLNSDMAIGEYLYLNGHEAVRSRVGGALRIQPVQPADSVFVWGDPRNPARLIYLSMPAPPFTRSGDWVHAYVLFDPGPDPLVCKAFFNSIPREIANSVTQLSVARAVWSFAGTTLPDYLWFWDDSTDPSQHRGSECICWPTESGANCK